MSEENVTSFSSFAELKECMNLYQKYQPGYADFFFSDISSSDEEKPPEVQSSPDAKTDIGHGSPAVGKTCNHAVCKDLRLGFEKSQLNKTCIRTIKNFHYIIDIVFIKSHITLYDVPLCFSPDGMVLKLSGYIPSTVPDIFTAGKVKSVHFSISKDDPSFARISIVTSLENAHLVQDFATSHKTSPALYFNSDVQKILQYLCSTFGEKLVTVYKEQLADLMQPFEEYSSIFSDAENVPKNFETSIGRRRRCLSDSELYIRKGVQSSLTDERGERDIAEDLPKFVKKPTKDVYEMFFGDDGFLVNRQTYDRKECSSFLKIVEKIEPVEEETETDCTDSIFFDDHELGEIPEADNSKECSSSVKNRQKINPVKDVPVSVKKEADCVDSLSLEEVKLEKPESLPELTSEMEEMVEQALKGNPEDRLFKRVYRMDLHTLSKLQCISNVVIDFYFNLLVERSHMDCYPSLYVYNTYFYTTYETRGYHRVKRWTNKVDIFSYDLNFIPIILDMHWCLVVIDHRLKKICYYNSRGSQVKINWHLLHKYVCLQHKAKKGVPLDHKTYRIQEIKNIPKQENWFDSGIFTCKYADCISRNAEISFYQGDIPYFRRRMIYELITKKLL